MDDRPLGAHETGLSTLKSHPAHPFWFLISDEGLLARTGAGAKRDPRLIARDPKAVERGIKLGLNAGRNHPQRATPSPVRVSQPTRFVLPRLLSHVSSYVYLELILIYPTRVRSSLFFFAASRVSDSGVGGRTDTSPFPFQSICATAKRNVSSSPADTWSLIPRAR